MEEEECWRQYEALRTGSQYKNTADDDEDVTAAGFHDNRTRVENESSVTRRRDGQAAHMDDVDEVKPYVYSGRDGEHDNNSTFWLRRLDAAESADPNRLLTSFTAIYVFVLLTTIVTCILPYIYCM